MTGPPGGFTQRNLFELELKRSKNVKTGGLGGVPPGAFGPAGEIFFHLTVALY